MSRRTSKTPKIKEMVENYFQRKEALKNIHSDEVVAYLASLIDAMDNLKDVNIKMNEIISISKGLR